MTSPEVLLRRLAQVAADAANVVEPPELGDLVESVTAAARLVFGAAACSVALLDEESDELRYVASTGAGAHEILGTRMPAGQGIAGWVAQSGQAVEVSDLKSDPRFARDIAEATHHVPSALMVVPIESGPRVLGVLTIIDRDASRPHAERDMELATMFAVHAAAAIRAVQTFREIDSVLLRELSRAATDGSPVGPAFPDSPSPASLADSRYVELLVQLRAAGEAEQQLALRVVEDVLAYARNKGGLSRPPH